METSTDLESPSPLDISIVIPIYNELDNIRPLYEEVKKVMDDYGSTYEVIFVDDGSSDGSTGVIRELVDREEVVRAIVFRRNFGQTAGLAAGFDSSRGKVVVPMDGDGQNDPADIPAMVDLLQKEGWDVVSGWRRRRKDPFLRSFLSRSANGLISRVSGTHLHDYGCTLKAYRAEVLKEIRLYGEMHRLIPIFCAWVGGKVTEVEVNHRPRVHGSSKYGFNRTIKVIIDLFTAKFLSTYLEKPAYVFGCLGISLFAVSFLVLLFVVFRVIYWGGTWISPLIFIGFGGAGMAMILVLMGILAELIARVYYESQGKPPYYVRERWDSPSPDSENKGEVKEEREREEAVENDVKESDHKEEDEEVK